MSLVCFFRGWPDAGPCDGRLVRAHLIPQQQIKRAVRYPRGQHVGPWKEEVKASLDGYLTDPRGWVPCCGGPTGIGGHHGALDYSRKLRIPRDVLPVAVEQFAVELGLGWWLDREYGPKTNDEREL